MNSVNTFQIVNNYLCPADLEQANILFDTSFKDLSLTRPFDLVIELKANQLITNTFLHEIMKRIKLECENFSNVDLQFNKLWMVKSSYTECNRNELPYVPHFDYTRFTKGFIYLNDVTEDNGPVTLAKEPWPNVEKIRRNLPSNYMDKQLNKVPEDKSGLQFVPITSNASSLIIFNTNTLHKAGIVSNGFVRRVLRFDFEQPSWNKKSFSRRIKDKILSL